MIWPLGHRGRTTLPRSIPVVVKNKIQIAAFCLDATFHWNLWYGVLGNFNATRLGGSKRNYESHKRELSHGVAEARLQRQH